VAYAVAGVIMIISLRHTFSHTPYIIWETGKLRELSFTKHR